MPKVILPSRPSPSSRRPALAFLLILALLLFGVAACGQPDQTPGAGATENGTETTMSESDFPQIFYAALGGAPTVDARLSVDPDGTATLYVGTSDSLIATEVSEVGFYRGNLAGDERQALLDLVESNDLADKLRDRQSISPDPVTGYLTLTRGEQLDRLVFAEIDNMPAAVEATVVLDSWMMALLDAPWRTAQTDLAVDLNGNQAELRLTITNRGTEALPVILLSEKMASQFLKMELSVFSADDAVRAAPLATAKLDRDTLAGFVEAGAFSTGWYDLPPNQPLVLDLPPLKDLPPGELQIRANFLFWLPGDGLEERLVIVRPPVVMLTVPE